MGESPDVSISLARVKMRNLGSRGHNWMNGG